MKNIYFFLIITLSMNAQQEQLPFYEIGEYPTEFSSTNVVSRMVGCFLYNVIHWRYYQKQ